MTTDNPAAATKREIPDINALPARPIMQTLVSKESWVRVVFYGKEPTTKDEIQRTIELLCMIHNGWE